VAFSSRIPLLRVAIATCVILAATLHPAAVDAAPLTPRAGTAKAVYSFDIDAGVELYALNEHAELPMASTTKIATALVLVRHVDPDALGETVTIDAGDLGDPGESTMALAPGDVVTWTDLLYGLLLPSGNDAARATARVIGGQLLAAEGDPSGDPIARFVAEMNALASALELEHTRFLNPTGLHQDGHYTSARDLAVLARRAFTQRTIREVVRTKQYEVTYNGLNPRQLTIETTVKMFDDPGVLGGKTGTTSEAGACLVLMTQERGGNRVITVTLGSDIEFDADGAQLEATDQRYADMRGILAQMDEDYRWVDISRDEDMPGLAEEMAAWQVDLRDKDSIVVPNGDGSVSYLLQLGPEVPPEEEAGRVLFFLGSDQVAERPVIQLATGG
jgi:serine-type D-Ala-D-Ala carboxypeptidase (penicillin-binding protein 5/6)